SDRPFTVRALTFLEEFAYSLPYLWPDNRRVLARFPSEIPVATQPDGTEDTSMAATNLDLFNQFAQYLATTDTPKLFFYASPGLLGTAPAVDQVKAAFNTGDSLTSFDFGLGYHFFQEDYPERIGQEIARWLRELDGEPESPSADFPYASKYVNVLGSQMHYVEEGEGKPILLLHGNPTSSYLWRNIIPFLAPRGRVIALDLIGMGQSDKPDIGYTYAEHIQYVEGFIDALDLEDITLVIHDWGSALGLDYAARNPGNIRAIAFMEAVLPPLFPANLVDLPPFIADFFTTMRDPVLGPELILNQNFFIEEVLPSNVVRPLSPAEMAVYRAPYPTPESREPLLVWPNQVPIDGVPADVVAVVQNYSAWLDSKTLPTLHLHVTPGALNPPEVVDYLATRLSNHETFAVGEGIHFIQEDHPETIGLAIADWLQRVVE
ncbi:MAG: haloalkane dehalogenase, partial [Myxococcota bacterium]